MKKRGDVFRPKIGRKMGTAGEAKDKPEEKKKEGRKILEFNCSDFGFRSSEFDVRFPKPHLSWNCLTPILAIFFT